MIHVFYDFMIPTPINRLDNLQVVLGFESNCQFLMRWGRFVEIYLLGSV